MGKPTDFIRGNDHFYGYSRRNRTYMKNERGRACVYIEFTEIFFNRKNRTFFFYLRKRGTLCIYKRR